MRKAYFWLILGMQSMVIVALLFVIVPKLSLGLISSQCPECSTSDAISIASQMGRLDVVSLVLAMLAIAVAFFAIFSFLAIRDHAAKAAERIASEYMKERHEEVRSQIDESFQLALNEILEKSSKGNLEEPEEGPDQDPRDVKITNRKEVGDNGSGDDRS